MKRLAVILLLLVASSAFATGAYSPYIPFYDDSTSANWAGLGGTVTDRNGYIHLVYAFGGELGVAHNEANNTPTAILHRKRHRDSTTWWAADTVIGLASWRHVRTDKAVGIIGDTLFYPARECSVSATPNAIPQIRLYVMRSEDGGVTWTSGDTLWNYSTNWEAIVPFGRAAYLGTPGSYGFASYSIMDSLVGKEIMCLIKTTDYGQTWAVDVTHKMNVGTSWNSGFSEPVIEYGDGKLLMMCRNDVNDLSVPLQRYSLDGGLTWSDTVQTGAAALYARSSSDVTVGGEIVYDGTFFNVFWYVRDARAMAWSYATPANAIANVWSTPLWIQSVAVSANGYPSCYQRSDGFWEMLYSLQDADQKRSFNYVTPLGYYPEDVGLQVKPNLSYHLSAANWTAMGVTRPISEFRFADGSEIDTVGATGVINDYGSSPVSTITYIGNGQVSLTESPLLAGQAGLTLSGVDNDSLKASNTTTFDQTTGAFSIEVDFAVPSVSPGGTQTLCGKKQTNAAAGYEIQFQAGGTIVFQLSAPSSSTVTSAQSPQLVANYPNRVIVVRDTAGTDSIKCFLNGTQWASASAAGAAGSASNARAFRIGNRDGASQFWTGNIYLLRIWNVALTKANVDSIETQKATGTFERPFPSIQAAINTRNVYSSATGAPGINKLTRPRGINVHAGTYNETVQGRFPQVVRGRRGQAHPVINGVGLSSLAGTTGFTSTSRVNLENIDVRGFTTGIGVLCDSTSDSTVVNHAVIDSCLSGVRLYGSASKDSIINCTIDGANLASSFGIRTVNSSEASVSGILFANNILTNCVTGIARTDSFTVSANYNAFYGNTADTSGGISYGANDQRVNPKFKSLANNDYRPTKAIFNAGTSSHNISGVWIGAMRPAPAGTGQTGVNGFGRPAGSSPAWGRPAWGR